MAMCLYVQLPAQKSHFWGQLNCSLKCDWAEMFAHKSEGIVKWEVSTVSSPSASVIWTEAIPFWRNSFIRLHIPPPPSQQLWLLFDLRMFPWKAETLQTERAVTFIQADIFSCHLIDLIKVVDTLKLCNISCSSVSVSEHHFMIWEERRFSL